jgi:Fur family transcriptional regulator, zinc uptake regulator
LKNEQRNGFSAMKPQPCSSARSPEPREGIALASTLCSSSGTHLTALRRDVLQLLLGYDRPAGAYELIRSLKGRSGRTLGPTSIYRVLNFLVVQGLASRIESRNAYVACAQPDRPHVCMFFLCNACGASTEIENDQIEELIAKDANALGFEVARPIVEIEGTCPRCAGTS